MCSDWFCTNVNLTFVACPVSSVGSSVWAFAMQRLSRRWPLPTGLPHYGKLISSVCKGFVRCLYCEYFLQARTYLLIISTQKFHSFSISSWAFLCDGFGFPRLAAAAWSPARWQRHSACVTGLCLYSRRLRCYLGRTQSLCLLKLELRVTGTTVSRMSLVP